MASDGVKYKAFSGLRNNVESERFTPADLLIADNVDIDKSGRLARRQGFTRRNATAAHSLWASGTQALFVSGTQLMRLNADFTTSALSSVSGATMSYCQAGERVYFSDAAISGVFESGVTRSWGLAVPAAPGAALVTGSLMAGRYQCAITSVRTDGQESGAGLATEVIVAGNQSIRITLPTLADTSVASRNIYMTTPNGELLYLAATLPRTTLTSDLTASTVAALTFQLATQFLQPAPAGQLVAYYKGYMLVAAGNVLYMSEPFAPELFDLRNYIDLGAPITLLAPLEDKGGAGGLFVGTSAGCGILAGSGPDDFQYVAKTGYGAIPGTLAYAEGVSIGDGSLGARPIPLWLSTQGICMGTPGLEIDNLTRGSYNFAASGTGAGLFIPEAERYIALWSSGAVALRASAPAQRPGRPIDPGSRITSYSGFAFNSLAAFNGTYLGASAAGIFELVGDSDAGVAIAATVSMGNTDFGSSFDKGVERLYLGYRASTALQLSVAVDDQSARLYELPALRPADQLHGSRVKVGKGLAGRYWRFELGNTLGGDFSLDELEVVPSPRQRRPHA